jgi:D-alanine-D-alanine ligase
MSFYGSDRMIIAVMYRKNRNIEHQIKVGTVTVRDDAYDEAYMHAKGLMHAGYEVELVEWRHQPEEMTKIFESKKIDLVFNVSSYEEALFFETYKIPYVGTSAKMIALDKVQRKILCAYYGVKTANFQVAKSIRDIPIITLDYPVFVKPIHGRGSAGIDDSNIVYSYDELVPIVKRITEDMKQEAIIETYIQGKEVTVGVLGYDTIEVLPILEIKYSSGKTNSFEHKMNDHEIIECPTSLDVNTKKAITNMAKQVYRILEIKDFGRIDIMLDQNNTPYFLEVNTFAGLNLPDNQDNKAHIGYMGQMAIANGYNRATFLDIIVKSAQKRYQL